MNEADAVAWAEAALGHSFTDRTLILTALTHPSAPGRSYQRLEFLGDRVLGCAMADWLYRRYPGEPEGDLAKRYADLVCTETCAEVARAIEAYRHIRMAASAAQSRVQHLDNVLADVCEALIGALYRDGGLEPARRFIEQLWLPMLEAAPQAPRHPKSALQEWAQGRGLPIPSYTLVERAGPDHLPTFTVELSVRGLPPLRASGPSKQEAERTVAAAFLDQMKAGAQ